MANEWKLKTDWFPYDNLLPDSALNGTTTDYKRKDYALTTRNPQGSTKGISFKIES